MSCRDNVMLGISLVGQLLLDKGYVGKMVVGKMSVIGKELSNLWLHLHFNSAEYVANVFGGWIIQHDRMAALEGETNVISTSSERTVQFVAISTICSVGDNIIQQVAYMVELNFPIYLESMKNPKFNIPDFEAICKIAYDAGIQLSLKIHVIFDNTFGTGKYKMRFFTFIEHGGFLKLYY
ncbi:hypothetical protein RhiirA5_439359 [Rhizophagus irregularis]|uniref:Uncharacterized protein n=1 Tax=Rhizophagus irregularis TaxID=588596 RepID=A0A2N0NHX7_9GLOM|nr:hypothetical protein RhiirA5_439359 [Rhizophagus irregularis]